MDRGIDLDALDPTASTITRRIGAVLDYDGIPEGRRVSHLAKACGFSEATARRLLNGTAAMRLGTFIKLVRGLDVEFSWLLSGRIERLRSRTMRIYVERIKGYPAEDAARITQMLSGAAMGHRRAMNLLDLAAAGQISFQKAAQLLSL